MFTVAIVYYELVVGVVLSFCKICADTPYNCANGTRRYPDEKTLQQHCLMTDTTAAQQASVHKQPCRYSNCVQGSLALYAAKPSETLLIGSISPLGVGIAILLNQV